MAGVETKPRARPAWRRFVPIAVLLLALVCAQALDLDRYVSFETFRNQRAALELFVAHHLFEAVAIYVVVFIFGVAVSLPVPGWLALAGGYLFGPWLAFGAAWISANVGALLLFLVARTVLGGFLRKISSPWMARFEAGFRDSAFNYVLALRLVTVIPFWVVNLAPAFFAVKLRDYALATLIGTIPSTLVVTSVGAALHQALAVDASVDPFEAAKQVFLSPPVLAAIGGLLVLALFPVVLKRLGGRKRHHGSDV